MHTRLGSILHTLTSSMHTLEYELARLYLPGSMHTVATTRRPGMADPGRLFPAAGMANYGSTSYH